MSHAGGACCPRYAVVCCGSCGNRLQDGNQYCYQACPNAGAKKIPDGLTEEAPLTKAGGGGFKSCCRSDGLKIIICSFIMLTIAITAALIMQLFYNSKVSQHGTGHGAVASDYKDCSQIGTNILRRGGNAVDAAVAATLCITVVSPHKTGLGGGGFIMIYSHKNQQNPLIIDFANNTIDGAFAAANVRIPAVLRGLEFAQQLRGNLPWYMVVEPSVILARNGFVVSKELAQEVSKSGVSLALYGQLEPGQNLTLPSIAKTLHAVAQYGADVLYNGTLSHTIVRDSPELLNQLATYEPTVQVAKETSFSHYSIYYPPHAEPLKLTLEAINSLHIPMENASAMESQILVAKALLRTNFLYSRTDLSVEEERFSSVVAMDNTDTYVSIVTGLSTPLGLGRKTDAGFLVDGIGQGRSLASFTPLVFRDQRALCGMRGVLASDDATLTGQLLYNLLMCELNVSAAIENPRYYLLPDGIAIESDSAHSVDTMFRVQLDSLTNPSHADPATLQKSINAIVKYKDSMNSHSDSRGGGLASRF